MPFLLCALATLLASGARAAATHPPIERADAVFESGRSAREIPIEVGGSGLLFVRARVSGTSFWFLLDTASPSIFGERQATRLGLLPEATSPPAGRGERKSSISALRNLTVALPGVSLTQSAVSSFDVTPLQTALGHTVDGVLGTPFFSRFVFSINVEAKALELFEPPANPQEEKGDALPISLDGGLPYVEATISLPGHPPLSGRFLIDTGADSAVLLYSPFVDKHGLLDSSPKAVPETAGTKGDSMEAVCRAESLRLAHLALRQPLVTLSRSRKGRLADPRHAGLIGAEILRRFQIAFDYSRRRMTLRPNSHFPEAFDYDASGLTLQAQGPDLSTFEIQRVLPDSPGAQAGLRTGDALLALDGRPVQELTLQGVRRLLRETGKEYVLSVFRQGQILQVHLKCRRLL